MRATLRGGESRKVAAYMVALVGMPIVIWYTVRIHQMLSQGNMTTEETP